MRSFTGCQTCRLRKLKCNEAKPICGQCAKSARPCSYDERPVFRQYSSHKPPIASLGKRRKDKAQSRLVVENGEHIFDHGQFWVDVPSQNSNSFKFTTFTRNKVHHQRSPHQTARRHHYPKLITTIKMYQDICREKIPSTYPPPLSYPPEVQSPIPTTPPFLVTTGEGYDTPPHQEVQRDQDDISKKAWDNGNLSPHILTLHKLIGYQDGRLRYWLLFLLQSSSPGSYKASVEVIADWDYLSAKHYDDALKRLKKVSAFGDDMTEEDFFAAAAILATYEQMDPPDRSSRAHLSALPLFYPPTGPNENPVSPVILPRTAIQGPIFWSLARQDLYCAFTKEIQTCLDQKDVRLWQITGLTTDEDGSLVPTSPGGAADVRTLTDTEEDTKSNELTWLMGKISNFITSGDAIDPADYALPEGQRPLIGVTQEQLLKRWQLLRKDMHKWFSSLPRTFTPSARTAYSGESFDLFGKFEQVWYELPICAAAMQLYHMAMILLLVNQPQESTAIRSTVSARLNSYMQIQLDAHHHAKEICGISLAKPTDSVRINSVQALFVAGQVFHEDHEQKAVLTLLAGIENELGWTTTYHAVRLGAEWPGDRQTGVDEESSQE
ncbi:hypothetical protein NM208_g7708 [Fusarium decemcellulare]|uniref:Uncharacterized protein n=1 Tax=Fusarium decemcellulare TaxID=57161 RepID=A0ACC1S8B4_9HYPO|nr:hypothetical protein NM208_g7708 [Fusarium decemcellulare]